MPIDRARYPSDWPAISRQVRDSAGNRCEWCGAANHEPHPVTGSRVVLTVAHLGTPHPDGRPGDKHDVRRENLAALCQACHLRYDHADHVRHAAETRRRRRVESGQAEML